MLDQVCCLHATAVRGEPHRTCNMHGGKAPPPAGCVTCNMLPSHILCGVLDAQQLLYFSDACCFLWMYFAAVTRCPREDPEPKVDLWQTSLSPSPLSSLTLVDDIDSLAFTGSSEASLGWYSNRMSTLRVALPPNPFIPGSRTRATAMVINSRKVVAACERAGQQGVVQDGADR